MNYRRIAAAFGATVLTCMLAAPSQAAMLDPAAARTNATFSVLGTNLQVTEFASSQAGTVTLTLNQVAWGELLATLSTTISFTGRDDLQMGSYGQTIFDVAQNERFTTAIYAVAAGVYKFGAYQFDMQFTPSVGQVPLPAAGWMLLSGVAALAARSRRRRSAAAAV